MEPILKACGISYSYHSPKGATPALSNISFTVSSGEFLAIVGPSGCGKSTLLSLLSGLLTPEEGSIYIENTPLKEARAGIGYMLQRDHLFEWRSVRENAALGLEIRHQKNQETLRELDEMLESYGLASFAHAKPSELSGGMRQRAALIRTLILKPDLLLLDEPFSALDYQTRLAVCDDIASIIRETHKTAILITHDLAEAISTADRVLVLSERPGRIKAEISLSFDPQYDSPLKRRNAPEFSGYFNQVWKELQS
ncbi:MULTISPECIES: ATP-binding cassette domain-containing protein [unclassified Clostridium]|uniref:ABC transporter ATP-binding protein n=1 Tax=unclassified Clostridium TaxID=2614128 RepID=UPI000E4CA36E|nr:MULTISPECIES: ATP-binding cassette domain-containing protein [unclassified Clostridium]RHP43977.1 ATP-binding cassette domain-containing protein [Clostridium sp. AF32-12BH]RHV66458.1 ATP-binding cassette domain-containing protein [Clostridium sp. OM02-18AC]